MIGKNVFERLDVNSTYCDHLRDDRGNVDENKRYIFTDKEKNFYYDQYNFKWEQFLINNFPFFKKDEKGKLYIDYDYTSVNSNQKKVEMLNDSISLIRSTGGFDKNGQVSNDKGAVKIRDHGFYSER